MVNSFAPSLATSTFLRLMLFKLEIDELCIFRENIGNKKTLFFLSFPVIIPERVLSYTAVDLTNVNVLLNSKDVSEYLKIAPSGLEVCIFFLNLEKSKPKRLSAFRRQVKLTIETNNTENDKIIAFKSQQQL